MSTNNLTEMAQIALSEAHDAAIQRNHQQIHPVHLFLALISRSDGLIVAILRKLSINLDGLTADIDDELNKLPSVTGPGAGQVTASREFSKVVSAALGIAKSLKDEYISVEHLFISILQNDSKCRTISDRNRRRTRRRLAGQYAGAGIYRRSRPQ